MLTFFISKNKKTGSKKAFDIICSQIKRKPTSIIGLAAGRTTDILHKLISRDAKKNPKAWKKIKILQIDEILGASPSSSLSFNYELRKELKPLLSILPKKNVFLINGTKNPKITINKTYNFINKGKGIDLITLGIGPSYDTHIAYNPKGKSSINSKMRVVKLHPRTIKNIKKRVNGRLDKKYNKGITLGIKDILKSKKALLMAFGKEKKKSLNNALERKIDVKNVPASALQLHKDLTVITDINACKNLKR